MLPKTQQDTPRCIVCAAPSGRYSLEAGSYRICKCGNCGLEYTWPIPSEETIQEFYREYSDIRANNNIVMLNAERNFSEIRKYFPGNDFSIFDFGCGNGEFVEVAGRNCIGFDIFNKSGNERVITDISDVSGRRFDAITLWGVLEHLTDPVQSIRAVADILKVDGLIAITTVNAEGSIPFYYKPPEHLTYWTKSSIEEIFKVIGLDFEIIKYEPYNMLQNSDIYIDRLLSRTPILLREAIMRCRQFLPDIVEVPTNEAFIIAKRRDPGFASSASAIDQSHP